MNFLDQNALWHLLWLLPLLLAAWIWARTRRRRLLSLLLGERASSPEHVLLSSGRRLVRLFIFLAALLLLVLTVARPSWGERLLPAGGKGRDLLVVFDVSKSMLCKDVAPSRLEHAKWFLRQLMQKNPSDRYGLVAFAGTAFLECPLTADRSSLFQIIDELNPGSIPLGGTNIQKALETAIEAFKAAESGHRAIILITDGDEGYGDAPAALAKLNEMKIPLFVVGVGDPSQPGLISVRDENGKGFKQLRDSKGELVKSRLNEAMLSSLAAKANGVYARSTATDSCLPQIEDAVRKLVPKEYETGQQTRPIERFYYPLLAAFVLLLLWLWLSERRSSVQMGNGLRSASGTLLLAALFLGISVSSPVFAQEAPKTEKQTAGSLPSAVKSDAKNTESIPGSKDPVTLYNIAWDAQKKNDNASAGTRYEEAINLAAKRPDVRAGAYQNYGVIRHGEALQEFDKAKGLMQAQNLDGALKSLDSCLKGLDKAEGLYRESLRIPSSNGQIAQNQQILLDDRSSAEKLKKQIEELKKQQEKARQETQQAKDQQQKENQKSAGQEPKQQKQDKKQDKKQDGQDQEKNQEQKQQEGSKQEKKDSSQSAQPQSNAAQETAEAKKAVDDLKEQAKKLGQEKMEQKAAAAEKELEQAAQKQNEKNGQKAEEHLSKALKELGQPEGDKKNKDENSSGNGNDADKQDKQDKQDKDKQKKEAGEDKKLPEAQEAQKQPNGKEGKDEKELDPAQAAALLDLMANEEKNLRDALKDRDRAASRIKEVEKDW